MASNERPIVLWYTENECVLNVKVTVRTKAGCVGENCRFLEVKPGGIHIYHWALKGHYAVLPLLTYSMMQSPS